MLEIEDRKKKKKLKDGMRGRLLFGISVTQADFPYGKTKIVTLVPRYTILNKLSKRICVRQVMQATSAAPCAKKDPDQACGGKIIDPDKCMEFHPSANEDPRYSTERLQFGFYHEHP